MNSEIAPLLLQRVLCAMYSNNRTFVYQMRTLTRQITKACKDSMRTFSFLFTQSFFVFYNVNDYGVTLSIYAPQLPSTARSVLAEILHRGRSSSCSLSMKLYQMNTSRRVLYSRDLWPMQIVPMGLESGVPLTQQPKHCLLWAPATVTSSSDLTVRSFRTCLRWPNRWKSRGEIPEPLPMQTAQGYLYLAGHTATGREAFSA
jgi:hypothetical protein